MIEPRGAQPRFMMRCTEPTLQYAPGRSYRWVHMWSRHDGAICITESTSAMAKSCITQGLHRGCAAERWKRFLSLVSHAAGQCG